MKPEEVATLREMASYRTPYWFRQATSRRLVGMGMAEVIPEYAHLKKPAHRVTDAGRLWLTNNPREPSP